jgi:PAS domain S-box-containing protein
VPGDRFIELAQSEERHVLDVLFRHAREAVTVQDRAGSLVYANDRAAELVGQASGADMIATPVETITLSYEMIDEKGRPISVDDLPARRVLAGLDAPETTVGYRAPGSKVVRWSRINASPIKNDAGEVVWAVSFFLDITEHVKEREGERLLAMVNEALATSVTIGESLTALAGLLSRELGAWCEVHLDDHRGDLARAALASPGSTTLPADLGPGDDPIPLGSNRLQARVMKTGSSELISDLDDFIEVEDQIGYDGFVGRAGIRSVVCLPLGSMTVAGTLTLARDLSEPPFDSSDLTLLRRVCGMATVALTNARLFELEHETAEALRSGLAPSSVPEVPGLEIAARYIPMARFGHIGGDFYDILSLSATECAVVVGDIEGKGVPAAAAVGMARDTLRATIKLQPDPAVVFAQLNEALRSQEHPRMCTVAYARITHTGDGRASLRVSLAGHPPPALVGSDGEVSFPGTPCPPAGVLPSIEPIEVEVALSQGDTILLYTDGFALPSETPVESVAGFLGGSESESLEDLLDRMLYELGERLETVRDDILLLALRVV